MKRKILASFLIVIIVLSVLVTVGILDPWTYLSGTARVSLPDESASETTETPTSQATSTPAQLQISDFPISISPDWEVTMTNNYESTVELCDADMTYYSESGFELGGWHVSNLSPLQPGQSNLLRPPNYSGIASISFSVTVKAEGQEILITYSSMPEAPSTPETPSTPEAPPIQENDFLITIVPNRQVTITNNSGSTIQISEFSMTYDFYSYIMYNAPGGGTDYGPIVRGVLTSEESVVLSPGQSYPKTFNRQDMVAIVSCRFSVKDVDTGQTLTVTYP